MTKSVGLLISSTVMLTIIGTLFGRNTFENEITGRDQEEVSTVSEAFDFVYEGEQYRYAITEDQEEIISFKNGTEYVDVLRGAGTYHVYSDYRTVASAECLEAYTVSEEAEQVVVEVSYEMSDGSKARNQYTMYPKHIQVVSTISDISQEQYITHATLDKEFLSSYESWDKNTSDYWIFPSNGDFPYKEADSIVNSYYFADANSLHTFMRGEAGKELVFFEYTEQEDFLITVDDGTFTDCILEYDLVFENAPTKEEADYLALFDGRGASFATQIQTTTTPCGNTTLFYTDCVDFQIEVTNLESETKSFLVEYAIYDYDGNVHSSQSKTVTLSANKSTEIPLQMVSSQKGMYYIDLKVSDDTYSHRELYTFALMTDYDYQYSDSNPFGISGVRFGEYEPNSDTVLMLEALGASNIRVCISHPDYLMDDDTLLAEYLEQLVKRDIRINGQYLLMKNWVVPSADNAEEYTKEISSVLETVSKYLSNCESGNEFNLSHTAPDMETLMQDYIDRYFEPSYSSISEEYGLDIIAGAVGMSHLDWMEQMVTSGLYDRTSALATHTYGYPYSPDILADPNVEVVVESSLVRTRQFLDTYGDKTWLLNEVGYPTTALMSTGMWSGVDLRTQADYIVRANILGLSYGADEIETYCLYDQQNLIKGVSATNVEMNFGLFYYRDYFGRIMPKPSAIAFSNMTAALDGGQACEEIETASSTIRAFEMQMSDGQDTVIVAWSNCARLTNDRYTDLVRTPCLPWQNQWTATEIFFLEVDGDSVEVTDIMGNQKVIQGESGVVQVELSGSPCFIKVQNTD